MMESGKEVVAFAFCVRRGRNVSRTLYLFLIFRLARIGDRCSYAFFLLD